MKQPDRKKPSLPEEWLKHAESDFRFALIGRQDNLIMREQVCFHAQQAVEKAFKAVLFRNKIDFPFSHNIQELVDIALENGIPVPNNITESGVLTPYAVESRYPGYWGEIDDHDVEDALNLTDKVIAWAREIVHSTGEQR